ncbi:MAG: PAC2 family protein, partial [Micrococcus sp.]|nr:PAC2 family protein [Micrococcus sp.]
MVDPGSLYTVERDVWDSLHGSAPVLIHLLEGYVDAGQVGRQLSEHLRTTLTVDRVATFDHDVVHDYRSRRPQMVFDTNTWTALT